MENVHGMAGVNEKNGTENVKSICRFCGLAKRENRHLFQDEDFCENNFLEKINSVYPNILVSGWVPSCKYFALERIKK